MSSIGQLMQPFEESELRFFGPFRLGRMLCAQRTQHSATHSAEFLWGRVQPRCRAQTLDIGLGTFWGAERGSASFFNIWSNLPIVVKHFAMLVLHGAFSIWICEDS